MAHDALTCVAYFDSQSEQWRALYDAKATFRDRLGLFMHHLQNLTTAPARVLDFGCGPGVMSLVMAQMGYNVTGVDGAPHMIETAERERIRLGLSNASFRVVDATTFQAEPESYDAVICSSLIEYVEDDTALLRNLARALRPDGALLLSVPHKASIVGRLEDVLPRFSWLKAGPGRGDLQYSKRRYDTRELLSTLRSLSFRNFQCKFFEIPLLGQLGVPLSRLKFFGVMLMVTARKAGSPSFSTLIDLRGSRVGHLVRSRALSRRNLWQATPPVLRRALRLVVERFHPSSLLGSAFRRKQNFLRQTDHWPVQPIAEYQLAQLKRVCGLAYRRAYYRQLFEQAGLDPHVMRNAEDMRQLRTMCKRDLRLHLREMCTRPPESRAVEFGSTGGSSGMPLHFYMNSDRSATEYAYLVTSWERTGYRLTTPMAVLRGQVVVPDGSGLRHDYDPLLRHHCYSSFHMSDENIDRYLEHIATISPCYLHVYPSTVAALARFIRRTGAQPPPNVRGIIAESEIVYPEQRRMVEEVFGCRYFSCYGQSEKVVLASECEYSTDYHVWPTYGYFELLDEQGNPVTTPGQRGEIVGTSFINTAVPFIRYRTGDYATYVGDHCEACGRRHPIIRDIRGHRTQEVLIAADGSEIPWAALNMHDDTFTRVRQFQFWQDTPGGAILRLVPADGFGDADSQRILSNLGRKLEGRLELSIELVDSVSPSPRGKAIYVSQMIGASTEPRVK